MGLSRIVSKINGDFSRKSQILPIPRVFTAPIEGVPLGIEYRSWESKTRMMGLPGRARSLTISLAVWNMDTIYQRDRHTDRQTDGQTPGDSKDRV